MIVHHAGCSQERIEPESASVGYSVRYTGIAVCSVLGVATVVLSLFLFTKLVLKCMIKTTNDLSPRRNGNDAQRRSVAEHDQHFSCWALVFHAATSDQRADLADSSPDSCRRNYGTQASDDAAARRRSRIEERGAAKRNGANMATTKSLDDLIRSFFSNSPTDSDERLERATRPSNGTAHRPHLGVAEDGSPANDDGGDVVQIPYVAPPAAPTEPPTTTTPAALGLGATEAGNPTRFSGHGSHLEGEALPDKDRDQGSDGGADDDEDATAPSISGGIWE
ncbi:hypothetical protein V5799_016499 [Amblyomma americanum]|uniref:Uncharacterized protein n=1 Tax=Amblyomma americanum TaxID=6943 RepID=A0AAQ4F4U6_AMBAM